MKKVKIVQVPVMQKGGSTKQNAPIYTNDKKRVKAHDDSLQAYNDYLHDVNLYRNAKAWRFTEKQLPASAFTDNHEHLGENPSGYIQFSTNTAGTRNGTPYPAWDTKTPIMPNRIPPRGEADSIPIYTAPKVDVRYRPKPIWYNPHENILQLPIQQPNQLPTSVDYTPQMLPKSYAGVEEQWQSPNVQGGQLINPAGFYDTQPKLYQKGGKIRYQKEVPTQYYAPQLPQFNTTNQILDAGKPWENKAMYISPGQYTPEVAREAIPKRSAINKAGMIARNPITALTYKAKGQDIPDYLEYGDKNKFDNALNIINPLTYTDAVGRVVTAQHFRDPNQTLGEATVRTALDAAMVLPLMKGLKPKPTGFYERGVAPTVEEADQIYGATPEWKSADNPYGQIYKDKIDPSKILRNRPEWENLYKQKSKYYDIYKNPVKDDLGFSTDYSYDMLATKYKLIMERNISGPLPTPIINSYQNPSIQNNQQSQEQQSGVPFHLNNNQLPQVSTINKQVKNISTNSPKVNHIGTDNFTVFEDNGDGQSHFNFPTRQQADSFIKAKSTYQQGGQVMNRRIKITGIPDKMQVGGAARAQWNQYTQGIHPTEQWNHDRQLGYSQLPGTLQPFMVQPIQQEFQDWSSGKAGPLMQGAVKAPNGISPIDQFIGTQTGNYSYRPLQIVQEHSGRPSTVNNYGTDYEGGIAASNAIMQGQRRMPPQWESNDQGIPMTSNNPYRPYTPGPSRKQQGNWHTDEATDYSLDSVRTAKFGGNMPGTYNQLDKRWTGAYPGANGINTINGSKPDPYQTKRTLPEADEQEDGGNIINAEKSEQILGDFNEDGTPALMNVSGPAHTQGGKDVAVPDGAFVYSDTKALKIKDPEVLKMFNKAPKRGGYTPASIAQQYDLQKFTKVIADPKSDNTSRKTAQMMTENYLSKLQALSQVQEGMKQAKGLTPPDQQVPMQYGGPNMRNPMMRQSADSKVPMSQVFDENGRMPFVPDTGGPSSPMSIGMGNYDPNYSPDIYKQGERQFRFDQEPVDITQQFNTPFITPNNLQAENMDTSPTIGSVQGTDAMDIARVGVAGAASGAGTSALRRPRTNKQFTTPDRLALLNSGLNMAGIHKYLPWEAPVTGVIPQTVFMDPTRALAANSEQANSQANYASRSGNGPSTMANYLALQGQAGKQAADIVGDYANRNAAIANSANQGAAATTNQLLEAQRARVNRLHQGNTIAAQQYDNAQREARGDLLNTYTNAWKNRAYMNDLNQTSQYFQRDPRTGFMHFNDEAGRLAYQKIVSGQAGGSSKSIADWKQAYVASGGDPERAEEFADDMYREQQGLKNRTRTTTKSGKNQTQTTSYGPQQYGGKLDKFIRH